MSSWSIVHMYLRCFDSQNTSYCWWHMVYNSCLAKLLLCNLYQLWWAKILLEHIGFCLNWTNVYFYMCKVKVFFFWTHCQKQGFTFLSLNISYISGTCIWVLTSKWCILTVFWLAWVDAFLTQCEQLLTVLCAIKKSFLSNIEVMRFWHDSDDKLFLCLLFPLFTLWQSIQFVIHVVLVKYISKSLVCKLLVEIYTASSNATLALFILDQYFHH